MSKKQKNPPSEGELRDKNCLRKNELTPLLADPAPNVKNKPDYLPEILKQAKATNPKKPEWLTDICPICGKEYPYLSVHNPGHCERFNCLYALAMEALEKRGES